MKIFIDSAKLSEIEEAYSAGFLDGVTTNPSLLKMAVDELKAKGEQIDLAGYIEKILIVAKGTPVSLEVTEYTASGMVAQAKKIYDRFRNRVIFPILNLTGKPVAFGARILTSDKNKPKYVNSPETLIYHKSDMLYRVFLSFACKKFGLE